MSTRSPTRVSDSNVLWTRVGDARLAALSGDAFARERCRAKRRAGAVCCGVGYLAAVADGGVLITHGDGFIPPAAQVTHACAALLLGAGGFVGAWLITTNVRSDVRTGVLCAAIRALSPLFLFLAFESAGMAMRLSSPIARLPWYSMTVVAVSGLLCLIAIRVGTIARDAGSRTLALHCRLAAASFVVSYAALGFVVAISAMHGVDWTNPNSLPTRPFARGVEVALGGIALLGLVGIGVGIVLYEKVLLGLWCALRPAA